MANGETFGQQAVLRQDQVVIIVMREFRTQPVGGFRRSSGAQGVGDDDKVFRGVQRLAGAEQLARVSRRQHRRGGPRGAVQDQYRLARGIADRDVMEAQFGKGLAGVKPKIFRGPVGLFRCWILSRGRGYGKQRGERGLGRLAPQKAEDLMMFHPGFLRRRLTGHHPSVPDIGDNDRRGHRTARQVGPASAVSRCLAVAIPRGCPHGHTGKTENTT